MKSILLSACTVSLLVACGNDPVTNAGYFDDDLDRSIDTSSHDDHSQNNTTITSDDHSDRSSVVDDHSVVNNHYYPDTLVVTDTIYKTRTDTLIQRIHDTVSISKLQLDTIFTVDTIKTVTKDTVVTIKRDTVETVKTLRDTIRTTIYDTVTTVKFDTITEIKTVRDTVRLLQRDTVSVPVQTYYDSLQSLYDELPYYSGNVVLNDYTITYSRGDYISIAKNANTANISGISIKSYNVDYIDIAGWALTDTYSYGFQVNNKNVNLAIDGKYTAYLYLSTSTAPAYYIQHPSKPGATHASAPYGYCILITQVRMIYQNNKTREEETMVLWDDVIKLCGK